MSHSKPVIPQNDNVAHALAGAGGGILSMILTYPLITLSTRAQVESTAAASSPDTTKRAATTSFLAAARRIVAREGLPGLYAGLSSALFGISVTNFVYYYWYEWARGFFERRAAGSRKLTTLESMAAGAIAGCATVVLTNPIWVVNTRVTTRMNHNHHNHHHHHDGVSDEEKAEADTTALGGEEDGQGKEGSSIPRGPTTTGTLLHLLRTEGPGALFAGVVPALVLVINPILQYTLFEQMKNAVERRQRRVTPGVAFVLGALGKLLATSVTYPYITVKSRMHVAGNSGNSGGGGGGENGNIKKEGMVQALSRVVREEGYGGLYKGIGPKLTQSVLTAAFLFAFKDVLYEQTVRLRSTIQARKALHGR